MKSLSCVWLLVTPWTAAHQAPPPMGFSRQEYWSRVPLPFPNLFWLEANYFTILWWFFAIHWHESYMFLTGSAQFFSGKVKLYKLCSDRRDSIRLRHVRSIREPLKRQKWEKKIYKNEWCSILKIWVEPKYEVRSWRCVMKLGPVVTALSLRIKCCYDYCTIYLNISGYSSGEIK